MSTALEKDITNQIANLVKNPVASSTDYYVKNLLSQEKRSKIDISASFPKIEKNSKHMIVFPIDLGKGVFVDIGLIPKGQKYMIVHIQRTDGMNGKKIKGDDGYIVIHLVKNLIYNSDGVIIGKYLFPTSKQSKEQAISLTIPDLEKNIKQIFQNGYTKMKTPPPQVFQIEHTSVVKEVALKIGENVIALGKDLSWLSAQTFYWIVTHKLPLFFIIMSVFKGPEIIDYVRCSIANGFYAKADCILQMTKRDLANVRDNVVSWGKWGYSQGVAIWSTPLKSQSFKEFEKKMVPVKEIVQNNEKVSKEHAMRVCVKPADFEKLKETEGVSGKRVWKKIFLSMLIDLITLRP